MTAYYPHWSILVKLPIAIKLDKAVPLELMYIIPSKLRVNLEDDHADQTSGSDPGSCEGMAEEEHPKPSVAEVLHHEDGRSHLTRQERRMKTEKMKQKGFIKAGGGIDFRKWVDDAKAQGYAVVLCGEYCELWA